MKAPYAKAGAGMTHEQTETIARATNRPTTPEATAAFLRHHAERLVRSHPEHQSYSVPALVDTLQKHLCIEDVVVPDPRDGRATLTIAEPRVAGPDGLPMPYSDPLSGLPAPFPLERLAYEVLFARPSLAYKWPR